MKTRNLFLTAAAVCASAVFTGCSSEMAESVQTVAESQVSHPIAIQATKAGGDVTRALALDLEETTLSSAWAEGEKVYVYKYTAATETEGDGIVVELQPNSYGSTSTTLVGDITGTYTTDDKLVLYYLKPKTATYAGQNGTIANISANYDFSKAIVAIEAVTADGTILRTGYANFERQQSITKFMLYLGEGTSTPAFASALKIKAPGLLGDGGTANTDLTITPAEPTNKFFVALRNIAGAEDYTFTATVNDRDFTVVKSANLPVNKYLGASLNLKRTLETSDLTATLTDLKEGANLDGTNVSIKDGETTLTQTTDYTLSYAKSGDPDVPVELPATAESGATYKVYATFTGIYEGTEVLVGNFSVNALPTAVITVPDGKDGMIITMGDNSQVVDATAKYGDSETNITDQITYSATDGIDGGSVNVDTDGKITPVKAGTAQITISVAKSDGVYNGATKTITVYVKQAGMGGDIPNPINAPARWRD